MPLLMYEFNAAGTHSLPKISVAFSLMKLTAIATRENVSGIQCEVIKATFEQLEVGNEGLCASWNTSVHETNPTPLAIFLATKSGGKPSFPTSNCLKGLPLTV